MQMQVIAVMCAALVGGNQGTDWPRGKTSPVISLQFHCELIAGHVLSLGLGPQVSKPLSEMYI